MDSSASSLVHELAYTHDDDAIERYEMLEPGVLHRLRFSDCGSPLIVPVPFNKYGDQMMQTLQKAIADRILRIHSKYDDIIISLKSAKNKPSQPYCIDKPKSVGHDTLDSLRLSLCALRGGMAGLG